MQGDRFGNSVSTGVVNYPASTEISAARAISYSADRWTDRVRITNSQTDQTIYNLSVHHTDFRHVGDPYTIPIPPELFVAGEDNTILVGTGLSSSNQTAASTANRMIYEIRIDSILGFGDSFFSSEGCKCNITYDDNTTDIIAFPSDYNGTRSCDYALAIYDQENAMDDAAFRLFTRLDFDLDGKLGIKFTDNLLQVETITTEEVPTLWGPATMEVRVW